MERKYYFRGLGLGIAVTAVIMGIALSDNRAMTNDEIIARAKELGMVENTVLADTGSAESPQENMGSSDVVGQDISEDQSQDIVTPEHDETQTGQNEIQDDVVVEDSSGENDAGATDVQPADSDDTEEDEKAALTPDDEETGENETTETSIPAPTVRVITINRGEGSYTVAKKLADVGVVASAGNFDTFLCENGYDKRLRTGSFSIPADASDEQIARIITGAE